MKRETEIDREGGERREKQGGWRGKVEGERERQSKQVRKRDVK
jgi:hypothetical protein